MNNDTYDTEPMSKDEIADNLKTMVFGVQAFERFNAKERKTLDMTIEALEQEPVLDKIRAEIYLKQYDFMADKDYDEGIRFGLMLAHQIIDKYRTESEE